MKKVIVLILCLLVICTMFAACAGDRESFGNNGPSAADSGTATGEEKVIHLVTDLGKNTEQFTWSAGDSLSAQDSLDNALNSLGNLPEGYRVEVEVLPSDEAEFQSRLTRLRTEIMSGGGPDVFVLSTAELFSGFPQERLFPDPYKAMLDGFFLPLDEYVEHAQFMKLEEMNPVIMNAGCTPSGRFALPMCYTYGAAKVYLPVTDSGAGWNEVMTGDDETLAACYARAASLYFHNIFANTVDYKTKTLTFTEEELYGALAAALPYELRYQELEESIGLQRFLAAGEEPVPLDGSKGVMFPVWYPEPEKTVSYLPVRNTEGGVSASVTSYIAINKNTLYPNEAFHVVDVMMSKKFQSRERFWESVEYKTALGDPAAMISVFSWSVGLPVYDEFLQEDQPLQYVYYILEEMLPRYHELRGKLTDARIISNVDQAIDQLYNDAWRSQLTPGDELKKLVSQAYDKMTLMAGEM